MIRVKNNEFFLQNFCLEFVRRWNEQINSWFNEINSTKSTYHWQIIERSRSNSTFKSKTHSIRTFISQSNFQVKQKTMFFVSDLVFFAFRHLLTGATFGLTDTVVPYPTLSNLLYNITSNPPTEISDAIKYHWLNFEKQIRLISKTLTGFDSLLTK